MYVFLSIFSYVLFPYCTGGSSKAKDGLPGSCKDACLIALSQLEELSKQLRQGDIAIKELQKIYTNMGQIKRLCEAAESRAHKSTQNPQSVTLHSIVKQRLDEYQVLKECLGHLQHLCHMIDSKVEG